MNVQSIVEKSPAIELVAEQQFATTEEEIPTKYSLKFEQVKSKRFKIPVSAGLSHHSISCAEISNSDFTMSQIYISKPTHWEKDGSPSPLMPNEARLRNLTYSAPLYAGV